MPRTLSPDTIAALSSGSPRFAVLVRIQTPSLTLRMTSDTIPVSFGGETYTPGTLGGIGTVKEGGKMEDTSIGIDFSGVDVPTLAVAASPDFLNSPVSVWMVSSGSIPTKLRGDSIDVTADNVIPTADEMGGIFAATSCFSAVSLLAHHQSHTVKKAE